MKASVAPALVSGANSFADYTEAVSGVPDVWSTSSGTQEFGYSAFGNNTPTATWGTSLGCGDTGTGVTAAAQKYRGFSVSDVTIATLNTVTPNAGITTNICFAAHQNAVYAPSGTYSATITATAVTL